MKWYEKILFVAWFGFCFALMTQSLAWAGDCSGPGDCGSVPDNNSTAAGIGGGLAGGGLAYNSHKKRKRKSAPPIKPDPCAGYQRGYDQEKSLLDTIDAQRQSKADAYNNALPKLAQLLDQFNEVAPQALVILKDIQALQLIMACGDLVAELAVEAIAPELGIGEAVEGQPSAVFNFLKTVGEIGETLHASSGSLEQIREWALSNAPSTTDVTPVLDMVSVGERMRDLAQQMTGLKNQYDGMQDERDREAQKVADAKAALDECHASQGDSAPAPS